MVEEDFKTEAMAILNAVPPAGQEVADSGEPEREPLAVEIAIGAGVVNGAVFLPLVLIALTVLGAIFSGVESLLIRNRAMPEKTFSALVAELAAIPIPGLIHGAIWGMLAGLLAWLLSDYKNRGVAGQLFVGLLVGLLLFMTLVLQM